MEKKVKAIHPKDVEGLKLAFSEVLMCCRTGIKTKAFEEFYEKVQVH